MLEHFSVAAMDAGSWLALALALLALAPLAALGRWARRRARLVRLVQRIPGPTALPLIGSLGLLMGVKREDLFTVFTEITRHYWPIMRFWKGSRAEIHLLRAEEAEVILSSTTHLTKSENYNFLRPWLGNGLLTGGGSKWHAHRKLITPTFHFKILESFLEVFIEKSQVLVEVLEKELDNTKGFDVFPYITLCTLDVICETAMGTQINAQHGAHSDYVKALYDVCEGFVQRVLRPWQHSDFVFYRSKRGKAFTKALSEVHGFTNKVIRDRKNSRKCNSNRTHEEEPVLGAKRRLAFLDLLLEASGDGASLTDEEIRQEVDTFMFAGHDTTAAGICWALFLLGSHPEAQERAAAEQEAIFGHSARPPTTQDLARMKYLERVVKETLRLFPSAPFIARRLGEDLQVGEYTIPEGANVAVRIFHVHRDPRFFPDPEKFDPDNFLPERVQGRHPYAYIPFSAGSRNCIGQKFALLEEKSVLSALLRRFSFEALERREDLKIVSELILRPAQGVRLRLRRRQPCAAVDADA